jgi:hypothetical protein
MSSDAMTQTRPELVTASLKEAQEGIARQLANVLKAGLPAGETIETVVNGIFKEWAIPVERNNKAESGLAALRAQIEALKAQWDSLDSGDSNRIAKIAKYNELRDASYEAWQNFKDKEDKSLTGSKATAQQKQEAALEFKYWDAKVKAKEGINSLNGATNQAELHFQETRRSKEQADFTLMKSKLDYEYSTTGDIDIMYKGHQKDLDAINTEIEDSVKLEKYLGDQLKDKKVGNEDYRQQQAAINQQEAETLKLEKDRYDLMKQMYADPSVNFGEAWNKTLIKAKESLDRFNDTLAETVYSTGRDFVSQEFKDLIFGDGSTDNSSQITKLQDEMQRNAQANDLAYQSANKLSRKEGETNEQYLQRVQFQSKMNSSASQQFEYQTKELQLLQQINDLEQKRNNIILDRLKQAGEKVFDKVLDQGVGMLFNLFKVRGAGDGLPPMQPGGPIDSVPVIGGGNASSFSGGGVTVHVTGNNIYGYEDFAKQVDRAVRTTTYRRTA